MRNGDVAFVLKAGAAPFALPGASGFLGSASIGSRMLLVAGTCICLLAVVGFALRVIEPNMKTSKDPLPISDSANQPSISVPRETCPSQMEAPEDQIKNYVENGRPSENLKFETLSSLQNGGFRSVKVRLSCLSDAFKVSTSDQALNQTWRVTLIKTSLEWRVIKMAQLDN